MIALPAGQYYFFRFTLVASYVQQQANGSTLAVTKGDIASALNVHGHVAALSIEAVGQILGGDQYNGQCVYAPGDATTSIDVGLLILYGANYHQHRGGLPSATDVLVNGATWFVPYGAITSTDGEGVIDTSSIATRDAQHLGLLPPVLSPIGGWLGTALSAGDTVHSTDPVRDGRSVAAVATDGILPTGPAFGDSLTTALLALVAGWLVYTVVRGT